MNNILHINEHFFITKLIPAALMSDKAIYINPNQHGAVWDLCVSISEKPIPLIETPHYINTSGPEIIVSENIPDGEYRLFTYSEFIDFTGVVPAYHRLIK